MSYVFPPSHNTFNEPGRLAGGREEKKHVKANELSKMHSAIALVDKTKGVGSK